MVTVVMPAFCAEATIEAAIEALAAQDYQGSWEGIVVDNGSTDDTVRVAQEAVARLPRGRVLIAAARRGPSHARNRGTAAAEGELIAFCDADDAVEPGWLAALVRAASEAEIVAGGFRYDRFNDRLRRSWHGVGEASGQIVGHSFLPHASGGNCAVRAYALDRVGGFDESLHRGQDMEFAWRVQLAGYRFSYVADAVVQRRLRTGTASMIRQHFDWGMVNVDLYSRFRAQGMPANRRQAAGEWAWLATRLPAALASRRLRGCWVRRLATRAGQLAGSVRHGVVYP